MLIVTKCIGVKSFVKALINMVCELKVTSWSKKIVQKFHGDPKFRGKDIYEKHCYATDEIHSS